MRRDLALAGLGLALAAAYWWAARALPTSLLADEVGADGVPKALAALLAALSIVIGLRALAKPTPSPDNEDHWRALGVAGLAALYLVLAAFAGYVLATALLAGAAALYYGAPRRAGTALFAVGSACALWLLFHGLLGVSLP